MDTQKTIARPADAQARYAEIARRYAWQAQQLRKRNDAKPDRDHLMALMRLRELERLSDIAMVGFYPMTMPGWMIW